jgi:hypothetical protein
MRASLAARPVFSDHRATESGSATGRIVHHTSSQEGPDGTETQGDDQDIQKEVRGQKEEETITRKSI